MLTSSWCASVPPVSGSTSIEYSASSGNWYLIAVPPRVPSGSVSKLMSCDRSARSLKVSAVGWIVGLPMASRLTWRAVAMYRSSSDGVILRTPPLLSKP